MFRNYQDLETRFKSGLRCPYCDTKDVIKWGKGTNDVQRYRCKECEKTFNERTGTPMHGVHKLNKWEGFIACMRQGLSTRKAADRLDLDHRTVWHWRHKVLNKLQTKPKPPLTGVIEIDAKVFRRSFKGDNDIDRKVRSRGSDASTRGLGKDKVQVVHCFSRSDGLYSIVVDQINKTALLEQVTPYLKTSSNLEICIDKDKSLEAFAKHLELDFRTFSNKTGERVDDIYHIQHVNSYHSRLENWMKTFRGVSTKYLANYMEWHVFLDERRDKDPEAVNRELIGESVALPDPDAHRCPNCGYEQVA